MISVKQIRLTISLILICMSTLVLSAEPNHPVIELEFVTEDRAPVETEFDRRPPIVPSYMAEFGVQWCFERIAEPNATDLLNTSAGKTLSVLQRELLRTESVFWLRFEISKTEMSRHDMPFGYALYEARAVSEEDAKKMAYAIVEFLTRGENASTRRMKKNHIEKLSAMREELRKKVAEKKEERKLKASETTAAYQKYKEAVANSPYSLYPSDEVQGEVRKTIIEMDKMLDTLDIEIVGIQSKLSVIKKYASQSEVRTSETLSTTLKEMAIREEIELAGAESRRQAIMDIKRREVYNQLEAYSDLSSKLDILDDIVRQDENELKRLEEDIDFLGPGERTFIIMRNIGHRNKVVIRQVKVKERYLNPTKP